jgi:hypothetical protein
MARGNDITEVTRRAIFDAVLASRCDWSGRLNEQEFLNELFDLESLPSVDLRYRRPPGSPGQAG